MLRIHAALKLLMTFASEITALATPKSVIVEVSGTGLIRCGFMMYVTVPTTKFARQNRYINEANTCFTIPCIRNALLYLSYCARRQV